MRRSFFISIYCITVLLVFVSVSFALEPPTKAQIEQYRKDGTLISRINAARKIGNYRVSPRLALKTVQKLRRLSGQKPLAGSPTKAGQSPPSAWSDMPSLGSVRVFALLIEFQDYPHISADSPEIIRERLFGDGDGGYPYESLRNYYLRSSYGKLQINGDVLGWYTAPYNRDQVDETYTGIESLIKEVITYYDNQGHDFSQYDNDGDGVIDYFMVVWTGPHGSWASFWWGYMTNFYEYTFTVDGKRLGGYSWQWESYNYPSGKFSPDTVIHETGHALGLPDYYDYDPEQGPKGGVGGLDIMDSGGGDHNCFSKFMLDWLVPYTINSGVSKVTLRPTSVAPDALLVMPNVARGDQFDEYFMVQNRYRDPAGNDVDYPTDGTLIWHIDARLNSLGTNFRFDNSYTDHKLIRLMEADGLEEIETGNGWADAGDYYTPGKVFSPFTFPSSNNYENSQTDVTVVGIAADGRNYSLFAAASEALSPIYRFWSAQEQAHFYTISSIEKEAVESSYPESVWKLEGISMYGFTQPFVGTVPVYRFWNIKTRAHFFTASETEKAALESGSESENWQYEGIGWYAFPTQIQGSNAVYRFWNPTIQSHFYTLSETERECLLDGSCGAGWQDEGVAWYLMSY